MIEPWEGCNIDSLAWLPEAFKALNDRVATLPPNIKLHKGVRKPVFGRMLIPFAYGEETTYCVDLNPGEGGSIGQIVGVCYEDASVRVVAGSFIEFMKNGIVSLEKALAKKQRAEKKKQATASKTVEQPKSTASGLLGSLGPDTGFADIFPWCGKCSHLGIWSKV